MVNYDILKGRLYGLDLMRAAAMLCVILTHSGYRLLFGTRYGIPAVESFFVVSGFLIGGILIRDFAEGVNATNLTNFWKKRWLRTLPLYYAVLLLKFIIVDHSIGLNILYYFTFLQSNFYGIQYLPVSWTLVVEEWFYLLMPLFFLVFFRKGIKPKPFYFLIALFIIADNLLRIIWVYKTNYGYGAMVGNFIFRMDSNLIGVGLAGIKMFHPDVFKR
ncbi:MAG: acyltransferase, partial [Bacteroidia bacterium]|nr:acyltransferase [Bacteroidia bacterium]